MDSGICNHHREFFHDREEAMTIYSSPTKSIPGGFLLVFFGILGWIYSLLAGYAALLVWQRQSAGHPVTDHDPMHLMLQSVSGFLIGLLLIWWGLRLARTVPPYDTNDPKEPTLKW
jgi:hypothetical protein